MSKTNSRESEKAEKNSSDSDLQIAHAEARDASEKAQVQWVRAHLDEVESGEMTLDEAAALAREEADRVYIQVLNECLRQAAG